MIQFRFAAMTALFGTAVLSACTPFVSPDSAGLREPGVIRLSETAPPGAAAGTCWGKKTSPAIVETVDRTILIQPAQVSTDGVIQQPAIYKRETGQQIVRERRDTWFQVPCVADLTPEFVSSLQRALAARDLYRGPINGEMTPRTRAAVRQYQAPEGLDSGILSTAAARKLGLVAVPRTQD